MIECGEYAKFETQAELLEAIEMGLDIEFNLYRKKYNISWRDDKPFICECPDGEAIFYQNAQSMITEHKINDNALEKSWKDIEVLYM